MFVKSTLKPATIRFIGKVCGKDCSGGGHKARRSEAFLHTKKMFYDILGSLCGQMFFSEKQKRRNERKRNRGKPVFCGTQKAVRMKIRKNINRQNGVNVKKSRFFVGLFYPCGIFRRFLRSTFHLKIKMRRRKVIPSFFYFFVEFFVV